MTPNKILTVFKEATKTFGDIAVKPTNNDLSCREKTLLPILLKIFYYQVETTHNLSGLIASSVKYTTKYGMAFKRPTRPKLYCPTTTATISDADQCKAKATHSASKEDYQLYEASEMGIMHFLTTNVDKTWYQEL